MESFTKNTAASPTMADIARRCGVSKGAVSLALNRSQEDCPLRGETRRRILREAERVGYRANWRGRMLAGHRTRCVAFLYNRVTPFPQDLQRVSLIAEELLEHQHDMMLAPALGDVTDWSGRLLDGRVDGAFVMAPSPDGLDRFAAMSGLPLVLLNLDSELDLPQVLFEDYEGARRVTRYLLELGHRRIVFYLPPNISELNHYSYRDRLRGFRDEMAEAGLPHTEVWSDHHPEWCARFCGMAKDQRPTAVLGYAQHTSMGLIHSLWHRGVYCPGDVSFAAFNDDSYGDRMLPSVTSVALAWGRLAEVAVDYLMRMTKDASDKPPRVTRLPVELITRQSTAPLGR